MLSDNNSKMIFDEMSNGYDYVVEYGMGASTLYFLPAIEHAKGTFISIENNFDWFDLCVEQVRSQTGFEEKARSENPWSLSDLRDFT